MKVVAPFDDTNVLFMIANFILAGNNKTRSGSVPGDAHPKSTKIPLTKKSITQEL